MKKILLLSLYCLALSWSGYSQSLVKFESNNRAHYCTNGFNVSHVNVNGLIISNTQGAWCDSISLELQILDFAGIGTYSLNYGSGNYGFYNATDSAPGMQTPSYTGDPGGGIVNITRYDTILGILEGNFSMVVSRHMYDTTDNTTVTVGKGYFSFGSCYAAFHLIPDAVPHHWWLNYQAKGVDPLSITFNWGDGTSTTGNTTHTYVNQGTYVICMVVADNAGCTASYCDSSAYIYKTEETISISPLNLLATGVAESGIEKPLFRIHPNPAANSVLITIENKQVGGIAQITDIIGRLVAEVPLLNTNCVLETAFLQDGLYLITLGRFTQKLLVSR